MGRAIGRVISAESSFGIENLTVSAVASSMAQVGATVAPVGAGQSLSLGSATTDERGRFTIDWDSESSNTSHVFELRIEVQTPDLTDSEAAVLFKSKERHTIFSASESFVIRIPEALLERSEIPLPGSVSKNSATVRSIREAAEEVSSLEKEWKKVAKTRVENKRAQKTEFDAKFKKALFRDISMIPEDLAPGNQLVEDGNPNRSISALNKAVFDAGVTRMTGRGSPSPVTKPIVFRLKPAQKTKLDQTLAANGNTPLSKDELWDVLRAGEDVAEGAVPTALTREDDLFETFMSDTYEERRAKQLLNPPSSSTGQTQQNGNEVISALTKEDVKKKLTEVVSDLSSPMGILTGRPGQDDVIGNIRDFALAPGPADEPAYFDFQSLNIAFDHVWKEFLDERIEPLARASYMAIVDRGGEPKIDNGGQARRALSVLEEEEFLIGAANVSPPPVALYAHRANLGVPGYGAFDERPGLDMYDPSAPVPVPGEPDPPPVTGGGGGGGTVPGYDLEDAADTGKVQRDRERSLTQKLNDILKGPYSFTAFGADFKASAINFGINITYRQRWEPVTYQVGELRRTITLAPGESRKYTRKTKVTRKRVEKEVQKNSAIRRDEFDTTTRGEAEIIRKAQRNTNFNVATEGTYNIGISKGDSKSVTDIDAQSGSDDAKKSFREAVIKASQEYKQERTLEISTEEEFQFEESETGEINNPNNELTVTYLFFELQRRFRINEQIYKATPVVLVAQDLPAPNKIDKAFLIRHGWIFKRALLDDTYEATLEYVAGPMAGDITARNALWKALEDHREIVKKLKDDLFAMKQQANQGYLALREAIQARIETESQEESDGLFADIVQSFAGGGQTPDAARAREEAARAHEQRAVEQVKQITMALQREITAYTEATEKFVQAQKKQAAWDLKILDLLVHVKENIIHYMQAVWAYEHPDQRFLRLHQKKAPAFVETGNGASYSFIGTGATIPSVMADGTVVNLIEAKFDFSSDFDVQSDAKPLVEIADLDNLLGFKGNYLIFPLKESNPLTDYMLAPYVDAGFRLIDPHDPGNTSREEFARYVCYLRDTLDDSEFEAIRQDLLVRFEQLLLSSVSNGDEIIVPSGSAYIEALPGANPLLEDFKLGHRAFDLVNAQEEARHSALENLRRAARILDDKLGDPDIEAKYLFEGTDGDSVVAPSPAVTPTDEE